MATADTDRLEQIRTQLAAGYSPDGLRRTGRNTAGHVSGIGDVEVTPETLAGSDIFWLLTEVVRLRDERTGGGGSGAAAAYEDGDGRSTREVAVPEWAVRQVLDYLDPECRFDHHGYCQAHALTSPCFVPALRGAVGAIG